MGVFLRKLWQNKPKQRGPWKIVHRDLFANLESIGIDSAALELAVPMWNPGNQIDYSKNALIGINSGTVFQNSGLLFNPTDSDVQIATPAIPDDITILVSLTPSYFSVTDYISDFGGVDEFSLIVGYQANQYNVFGGAYPTGNPSDTQMPITQDKEDFLIWRKIGTNLAGFLNRIKLVDVSITSGDFSPSANLRVGGRFGAPNTTYTGTMGSYIIFSTGLTDNQITLLSDNPYQLWQPVPQKTIFLPLDAGGGTTVTGILPAMSGLLTTKTAYHRSVEGSI